MPRKKVTTKKELPFYHPKGMPGDKRNKHWAQQRKKRGFDDRELWSLDSYISAQIYPRLVRFKEIDPFARDDEFRLKLDESLWVFKFLSSDERWSAPMNDKKLWKRVDKALKGFAEIYLRLWT